MHYNPYSLPLFSTALLSISFGIFILSRNVKSLINFSFFLFTLGIFVWTFSYGLLYSSTSMVLITFLAKLGHSAVITLLPLYYVLCVSLVKKKKEVPAIVAAAFAACVLIWFAFNSNLYFSAITKRYWGYYPEGGIMSFVDFILHVLIISRCGMLYIESYHSYLQKRDLVMCNRIKYIGLAFSFMVIALVDYFPKYFLNFYPFGYVGVVFFVGITSIAIIKHSLLDINVVIRKSLAYSILVTIITITYFILVLISENIFRGLIGYRSIVLTMGIITVFILIFQPLKNRTQAFVDKVFFKMSKETIIRENEKLMEALKRAEKMKAVGTLAAGLAHEIKNPLTSIKTFTEYLEEKYSDKDFRDKFTRIVGGEVERINSIVQQLLDFAKPRQLTLKDTDLHKLLDDTLNLLSNDLIKHRINLTKEYSDEIIIINADYNQLKQAFLNVLLNSIDAMKSGGQLTVKTNISNNAVSIKIIDSGVGISNKDLIHIFDPFYSTKDTGTGLGLSIVHNIIEEHGGRIHVESIPGKSTSFEISL